MAVLIEGYKEQQKHLAKQNAELSAYQAEMATQQARMNQLESRLAEFEVMRTKLNNIEELLASRPRVASIPMH